MNFNHKVERIETNKKMNETEQPRYVAPCTDYGVMKRITERKLDQEEVIRRPAVMSNGELLLRTLLTEEIRDINRSL